MTDLQAYDWPDFLRLVWVERVWGSFGWLTALFPAWVYDVIVVALVLVVSAGVAAVVRHRRALRACLPEAIVLVSVPVLVLFAVEAAYVSLAPTASLPEQGRYLFPAIAALAALAVGASTAVGRRWRAPVLSVMVAGMLGLNLAAQLLWMTAAFD